ncbi:mitochondrial glycoprotein [Crepidotus variabilis]|uniref:Mitochondrial glycoprotein n=1 Tax=Crepidotus variabilis TaxID=179855 RepID=A0A9P6JQ17_9AGAR|nr:mitochondrial glycoprotein [Crepidotus variabilis]
MNATKFAGVRAFSMTPTRLGSGTTDIALSQKLQEELKFEQEAAAETAAPDTTPEFLKSFLEQGVWSIEDVRGNDEVALTRKFGDENLRVVFSIADIAVEDEFEDPEAQPEEDDAETVLATPIRTSVSITKSTGPGALNIDLTAQDNAFTVENISFYDDAKVGTELTAEADWKRRGLYIGPSFETLDYTLQEEFQKYLAERGLNEIVASFIPEYAAYKEQQEYVKWLGKVKNFVDL